MKKILLAFALLLSVINLSSQTNVTIGGGTTITNTFESSPINIFYRSHHCQIMYTPSEINAAGYAGSGLISKLGFNIFGSTSVGLPNFNIGLKNTVAGNLSVYDGTGLTNVYTSALYQPVAGGFDMLTLSNNFVWDGTSNLLVDVCFDTVSVYSSTGQVYNYSYLASGGSQYQFVQADNSLQCGVATINANTSTKPQIQLQFPTLPICSGLPTPGFTSSSVGLVCPNTAFELSIYGTDFSSGLEFQWQSSLDGIAWNNFGTTQTTKTYTVASIANTTYYRCVTTCTASTQSNISSSVTVNFNPLMNCYCTINLANNNTVDCTQDKISNFSIANVISQSTNCDAFGYSDSTTSNYTSINLVAGNTYTLLANTLLSAPNGIVGAWIDFNANSIFDSNEFINLGFGPSGTYSSSIIVPITVPSSSVRMRIMLNAYSSGSIVLSPCLNNAGALGQVLDYKVNLAAAPICSGAPNAGNATSTQTAVCKNVPYTLDLSGNGVFSNINYQWQSSLNGTTWTNLGLVQNTIPYSVNSQSVTTYYRCITTCTTSAPISSTSTPVVVNQNLPTACYCSPQSINCTNTSFSNIVFKTLNDNPDCNVISGYNFNNTNTVTINANQTYTIATSFITQTPAIVGLWIDYNQDGFFDNLNEYTYIGSGGTGLLTGSISIPYSAMGGNTRMRIKTEASFASAPTKLNPCTSSNPDGQTLDYLIYINAVASCSATPNAGNATCSVSTICENRPFTLNLANNSIASNISYQWQYSINNVSWINMGSSQSFVAYPITSQSVTTYYRCLTTCVTSSITATSTTFTMNQNPANTCYCIPPISICAVNNEINHVVMATLSNTSACSTNGYVDYAGSVASVSVQAGQTYSIAVTVGSDYNGHVAAWIDYNKDGVFDTNEFTDLGITNSIGNYTVNSAINIPANAIQGTTKMRIRNNYSFSFNASQACADGAMPMRTAAFGPSYGNGETEDYLITISAPDCSSLTYSSMSIPITGSTSVCSGQSTTLNVGTSLLNAIGLSYQWKYYNGSAYVNTGVNSPTLAASPTTNTLYYCEIYCNAGYIRNSDTTLVSINSISLAPVTNSLYCNGQNSGAITLNATTTSGTLTYTWNPSVSTTDYAGSLTAGIYTVNIANITGCSVTQTIAVIEPTAIVGTINQTNVTCFGLNNGSATITAVTGGVSPYTYSWCTGGITSMESNLTPNNYTVTIYDANDCAKTQTITITEPALLTASITGNSSTCELLKDTLKSIVIGGTGPYSYNWTQLPSSSVSTSADYTYTTSIGTFSYSLSITDLQNCTASSNTISVVVNPSSNISGTVTTYPSLPVAGRVVLYQYLPFYTKFDSVAGQNIGAAGDYNFVSFTSGKYIVKAIPSSSTLQITYGDSAVNWKTAKEIIHGCAVNDIQNINVKALNTFTTTGTGTLSGQITAGSGYGQRMLNGSKPMGTPIGGILVKGGKNPGGQIYGQVTTDANGNYSLGGLPVNTGLGDEYFILVDIPGLDTNGTYHRVITLANNQFTGLDFIVDSAKINPTQSTVGIHDISAKEHSIKVFPNPATNFVTIQYDLLSASQVKIDLTDILGKSVKTLMPLTQQVADNYKTLWYLNDLKAGLYFIKMTINGVESTIKLSIIN